MIKQLNNKDYDRIYEYLDKDHINNVYPIHALQTYGIESQHAAFWGAFKRDQLLGVVYFERVANIRLGSLCADSKKILKKLCSVIFENRIHTLVGNQRYIRPIIKNQMDVFVIEGSYDFSLIRPDRFSGHYDFPVQSATEEHVSALCDLYKTSELGGSKNKSRQEIESDIRRTLSYESGYFFVERNNRILSTAKIIAETDKYGIIDGATTLPECRGQGIYPSVRTACLNYLFQQNKTGLTYIDERNKAMQKVVQKTGGVFVDKWIIVNVRKKKKSFTQRLKKSWVFNKMRS